MSAMRPKALRIRAFVPLLLVSGAGIVAALLSLHSLASSLLHGQAERAELMHATLWLASAILLLAGVVTWIVATWIVRPIRALAVAAQQLAAGTRELRSTNQDLLAAKAMADQANQAKGEYLAHVSHEIRTPMTAILGFIDVMLEPDQTPAEREEALLTIQRNARHLSELINNVLDLSKIEAGQMSVEQVDCDLAELIAETESLIRPAIEAKGLEFKAIAEGALPRRVRTDPLRVRQILVNLVSNARRFTEKGSIELRVKAVPASADNQGCTLQFSIRDTGIGMSPKQLARLFAPFAQADVSTARRFGGSGLGLTISKSLAKLLGGDITVASVAGQGSIFTVQINAGCAQDAEMFTELQSIGKIAPREAGCSPRISGRILLAEDGVDNQRLIAHHLRRAGATVAIARNGRIAVEMLERESFDLLFMDLQMPELGGQAALIELRKNGQTLPVVALTAQAMAEDRERCLRAGFDGYLSKPIDKARLIETARQFLAPADDATSHLADEPMRSELANDPELADVLQDFVDALPEKINRLFELLSSQQMNELRQFVHQLKGAAGGYGFPPITARAAELEAKLALPTPTFEEIADKAAELAVLIRRVNGYPASKADRSVCAA